MSATAWKIRLLTLGNVPAIPYVAVRFSRELGGYLRRVLWRGIVLGRSDFIARYGR